jgi:hypothetical protein
VVERFLSEGEIMGRQLLVVLVAVLVTILPLGAQSSSAQKGDEAAIVAAAQAAVVRAVNFREGDAQGWKRARIDFTPEGWADFVKHMQGFLDAKGAPTFNSSFVASHDAVVLDSDNGVVHFRIPGTLTQSSNVSKATYKAALEVFALRDASTTGGQSIKIKRLEQITCGGSSTACQ